MTWATECDSERQKVVGLEERTSEDTRKCPRCLLAASLDGYGLDRIPCDAVRRDGGEREGVDKRTWEGDDEGGLMDVVEG